MQRLYFSDPLPIDLVITDKSRHHQLTRVLRLSVWDSIIGFCGDGSETVYSIVSIDKKTLVLRGQSRSFPEYREPKQHITLYYALPNKYEKIEWIIAKATEVGVKRIVFFRSDRSQKLMISDAKKERFFAIMIESLEQCGGLYPVEIVFQDTNIVHTKEGVTEDEQYMLHTSGIKTGFNSLMVGQHCGIWVGPEGGWSPEEIQKTDNYWWKTVCFSERILRTETAGIVCAFGLLHQ